MQVANKLFPIASIAAKIEEFASEMLLSVVDQLSANEGPDSDSILKVVIMIFLKSRPVSWLISWEVLSFPTIMGQ